MDFLGFGVLLQVPILLFAADLLVSQRDQLAAQSLSRQAVRAVLESADAETAERRLLALTADAEKNFNLASRSTKLTVDCDPVCWQPGVVSVEVQVGGSTETSRGFRR